MPEKLKFDNKSFKKGRVLSSFPWYAQNLGEWESEKGEGKQGVSKSNHGNTVLRIRETKGESKNKHLENTQSNSSQKQRGNKNLLFPTQQPPQVHISSFLQD